MNALLQILSSLWTLLPATLPTQPTAAVQATCYPAVTEVRDRAAGNGVVAYATDGGLVVAPDGRAPRVLTTCDGLPSNRVAAVAAGHEPGVFHVATHVGALRVTLTPDGALAETEPVGGLPEGPVTAVAAAPDALWFGTSRHGVWRVRAGIVEQPFAELREGLVTALASPTSDSVYVGRGPHGLWRATSDGVRRILRRRYVRRLSREGERIVVHTPSARCTVSWRRPGRVRCGDPAPDLELPVGALPAGPPSSHVTATAVFQGHLFVGTFNHGLATYDGARWRSVPIDEAPAVLGYVNDLEAGPDALWLASPNGAARFDGARWHVLGAADGLPPGHVNAVAVDGTRVWLATTKGVLRIDDRGPVMLGRADGLPGPLIYDLAVDDAGRVLVATNRGVARWNGSVFERWSHEAGELSDNWVNAVRPMGTEIWAGTYDAGVDHRGAAGAWQKAREPGALWVNPGGLFDVGGVLVVATLGDGLAVCDADGTWHTWRAPRLVPDPDVTTVALYGGRFWVGTRAGLASWEPAPRAAALPW